MRFTLKQIRYFIAVAETGSVNQAAESVHVSPASISSAISQLESQLDVQLFVRHHAQGMSLTSGGQQLLQQARHTIDAAKHLQSHAAQLANKISGEITLTCFTPLAPTLLPGLCTEFSDLYPEVNINLQEAHQVDIIQNLSHGSADLSLTYDLQLPDYISFLPLAALPPYIVLSAQHPLANATELSLKELNEEKLVLLDLPLSADYFLSLFKQADIKPSIAIRTSQTEVMRGMIASGLGYGLANVRPVNQSAPDGKELVYIKLRGEHTVLTMGIAQLRNRKPTAAIRAFIEFTSKRIKQRGIPGMRDS